MVDVIASCVMVDVIAMSMARLNNQNLRWRLLQRFVLHESNASQGMIFLWVGLSYLRLDLFCLWLVFVAYGELALFSLPTSEIRFHGWKERCATKMFDQQLLKIMQEHMCMFATKKGKGMASVHDM